jgi:hypothetical protein
VKILAANRVRLMVKALTTQLSSIRPFSMKRSSNARTRTSTAASAKKEEQRGAAMQIRSKRGDGFFWGGTPPVDETSAIRFEGWEEAGSCCGETLRRELSTFL